MVMGRDSCSKGRGFESRHSILDGHFFTYICCKNCNVCLKRPKNKQKRCRGWPIFIKKIGDFDKEIRGAKIEEILRTTTEKPTASPLVYVWSGESTVRLCIGMKDRERERVKQERLEGDITDIRRE